MEKEKKNQSLLYNLYQMYKESKHVSSPESNSQETVTEPISSTEIKTESPFLFLEEEETVTRHLGALLELYKMFLADCPLSRYPDPSMSGLSQWIFAPLRDLLIYKNRKLELAKAVEDIGKLAGHFLKNMHQVEEAYQAALEKQKDNQNLPAEPVAPPSIHGSSVVIPLPDRMAALLFVFPPYRGGDDITEEEIYKGLSVKGIRFGTKDSLISDIVKYSRYFQLFLIAEGIPLTPSKDGKIIHHFKMNNGLEIAKDERGSADFRNLNTFQTIVAGTLICDIIPLDKGTVGHNIYGVPLSPKLPKNPPIPQGTNTYLSKDQTQLLATCDGHLIYRGNSYHVEPVLQIGENVDFSVGNIDFPGDVIVNGDVLSGFEIKAQGNILIRGMAESAFLYAEGNITILKGMNGNETGTIHAKGSVKSSFLEHCTIHSCGPIYSNTIICCEIHCEDSVYAQGVHGAIIGGNITALNSVEARMIGSRSLRKTTIILGELPRILNRKTELKLEQVEARTIIDKLAVNISYLDKFKASLPVEKLGMLEQLNEQYQLYLQKEVKLEEELDRLDHFMPDFTKCHVTCNQMYPTTYLHIGGEFILIEETLSHCTIQLGDEGIHIETL